MKRLAKKEGEENPVILEIHEVGDGGDAVFPRKDVDEMIFVGERLRREFVYGQILREMLVDILSHEGTFLGDQPALAGDGAQSGAAHDAKEQDAGEMPCERQVIGGFFGKFPFDGVDVFVEMIPLPEESADGRILPLFVLFALHESGVLNADDEAFERLFGGREFGVQGVGIDDDEIPPLYGIIPALPPENAGAVRDEQQLRMRVIVGQTEPVLSEFGYGDI